MQSLISKRWWIAAAVQALALLLSMSYGGFLSVAVAGVFLLLCMPNKQLRKKIFISGTIAAALFIAILSQTENFREHFAADRSSGLVRTQIWVTSWALIRQHPITGIGPNTFEQAYRKEVPRHYFPPLEWLVAQPHNLYLTLWLETGILGLMTFLGLLIYHTWFLFRTFFRDERHRGITIVSLAALLAILVHGCLDTPYFKNDLAIEFLLIAILPWLGQKTSEQK
jgi:O-antigen ligase